MRVLLCEPYCAGSHRAWAEGYRDSSSHDVALVRHDARFWKWRMHGGFVTLAALIAEEIEANGPIDALLVSDMVHVAGLLGSLRKVLGPVPVVLYMHENQLSYPLSPADRPDLAYSVINWTSMTVSDQVWFNSEFHRTQFFEEVGPLLRSFPDYTHEHLVDGVRARTEVVPVGIDLVRLDDVPRAAAGGPPIVLWNQRWEYDKGPDEFFNALDRVVAAGLDFRVILAGESFGTEPAEFAAARERLGRRVVHYGYASEAQYPRLLGMADIVVSTARQEFFGVAITEAIYAGAFPLLPARLVYPERLPSSHHDLCLYDGSDDLVLRLTWALENMGEAKRAAVGLRAHVAGCDWSTVAGEYDERIEAIAGANAPEAPGSFPPARA